MSTATDQHNSFNDDEAIQKKILKLYRDDAHQRKRKFGGVIRRMFKSDNTMIRPRKINHGWTGKVNNTSSSFQIRDLHDFIRENPQFSMNLAPESYNGEAKYRKKATEPASKSVSRKVLHQIEHYCDKSTLHGLRYVGDTSLSIGERVFWFLAFAFAIGFAAYYITNIFQKWNNNPVIIAFSPFDADLNDIPFPAITICNMNQAKKIEAERIMAEGSEAEKRLLNDYCNSNNSFNDFKGDAPDWNTIQNFLIKVGQSCSDIMKSCVWQSDKISCEDFFNNDLTDEGLCCSFNRLPPVNIFRNPNDITFLNQTYPSNVYDWSPEKGFLNNNDGNPSIIPIRPTGAGTHLGLSVVVDVQADNYFCSSTDSVGFKIIMANPIETPKIADFGYLISPGFEYRFIIVPDIRESSKTLRDLSVAKRQCFFQNERPLKYFRTYTKRNCRLECQSNYTLLQCDCIPYYLPKSKSVKVCGKGEEECVQRAKENVELTYGNGSNCGCLQGCFEMLFDKSTSTSKLLQLNLKHKLQNISEAYFLKNIAVLHFFFKDDSFRKRVKSEIYGFTEALSNIGGLLGLSLGFSILSIIEVVYFLSMRLICNFMVSNKRKKGQEEMQHGHTNNVIPFLK